MEEERKRNRKPGQHDATVARFWSSLHIFFIFLKQLYFQYQIFFITWKKRLKRIDRTLEKVLLTSFVSIFFSSAVCCQSGVVNTFQNMTAEKSLQHGSCLRLHFLSDWEKGLCALRSVVSQLTPPLLCSAHWGCVEGQWCWTHPGL